MSERPCVGLDPDTDPCPICGTWLSEPCPYDVTREGVTDGRERAAGPIIAGGGAQPPGRGRSERQSLPDGGVKGRWVMPGPNLYTRRREPWPTWRCGICGKQPCDGHGHHPVPVSEV